MLSKNIFLFILLFSCVFVNAQVEVINDLQYNSVIKQHLKNNASTLIVNKNNSSLQLPFRDDFSLNIVFPDQLKWSDSFSFINNTFPINPITVGVATLDGADQFGNPYDVANPNAHGIADYLTSVPINLNYPGDTSVYLSFYYQPQGRGNSPENIDSLVLEFEDNTGAWNHIWAKSGSTLQPFQLVMIHITDPIFLFDGFRFRFKNYATLSGQSDHWHIDYVLLDRLRSFSDTVFNDMAFVDPAPTPLEQGLTSMPWQHFLVDPAFYLKDEISYQVRNLSNDTRNVNFSEEITDINGTVTYSVNLGNQNILGNSFYTQNVTLPQNIFPATTADSAEFIMIHRINTTPDINRSNDTLKYVQRFYNYYSYDDGSAEKAYGLQGSGNPGSPCFGCKMAMEFNIAKPDTLQGVMIHFSQIAASVSANLFKLTVWSGLNPEVILYEEANLSPYYTDSINGFAIFELDPPLFVSGTFYLGTVQDNHLLNIGLDVNRNTNTKMYYNSTGSWFTSSIDGTWMIRPVFGQDLHWTSVNENLSEVNFNLYPNPASEVIYFNYNGSIKTKSIHLTDLTGRIIKTVPSVSNKINISEIVSGLYFISVEDKEGNRSTAGKVIITR